MQFPVSDVVVVSPQSLAAAFATIPDPRRTGSVRDPLPAMLTLAVGAILANQHAVVAIAEWGARQAAEHLRDLGFADGRTPRQATLQRLFCKLDGSRLDQVVSAWFQTVSGPPGDGTLQGVAIDGKAQRGRLRFAADGPVHVLSAFCHETGIVLAREPITVTADKAEAEVTVVPALLDQLDWSERVLTGDALFCQREVCAQVQEAGGDDLLLVKDNQPTLREAIALLFDPSPALARAPWTDLRTVRTIDTAHGRRLEIRELIASTDLTAWAEWPGLAQVFRIERTWREHDQAKRAVHYGIPGPPGPPGSA